MNIVFSEKFQKVLIFSLFFSFPFSDERVMLLGIPLYAPELIMLFALLVHIVRAKRKKGSLRRVPVGVISASLLMISGAILSAVANGIDRDALGAIKSWFLFPMAFGWLIIRSDFSEKDSWKALSYWFSAVAVLSAASFLIPSFSSMTYDGRLRSIFPSPNHFGFFLEYGAILGIGLMIRAKGMYRDLFPLIVSESAILTVLLMTESTGAIIAVAVASAVILAVGLSSSWFLKKVLVSLLVFIAFSAIFLFFSIDRDGLGSGMVRNSFASRVMIWEASAHMIAEHPFFGIGLRNFQDEYLALQPMFPPYLEWAVPHPHNVALSFLLFTGVVGFVGFVALLFISFRTVISTLLPPGKADRLLIAVLFGLLTAFLVHGMVDAPYFRNDLSYAFWAVVAFVVISGNKKDAEASE